MTIGQQIDALVQREGGYTDNPADNGGPTNFGVTEQQARAYGYTGDMRSLPIATARNIYAQRYWVRPGFDKVAQRCPALAEELFDCGVNMGQQVAATFFQRVLNVLNRGATDYPDIKADGDIGPMTLLALDGLKAKRPNAESLLLRGVIALKRAKYIGIAEANPSQEVFEAGWLDRQAVAA